MVALWIPLSVHMLISCMDHDVIEPIIPLGRGAVWQWALLAALLAICRCSRLFSAAQIGPFPATTTLHTLLPCLIPQVLPLLRFPFDPMKESDKQYVASSNSRGTLPCLVLFVIKHGARPTVHVPLQSTFSTTIPFLTSSISIGQPSLTETRVIGTKSLVGRNGTVNDGGTNSHKFAKDGETSYLGPRPTWIFASSVHMAHQLQTCWHIRLPFHLSWIIFSPIGVSLQKMARE